MAFDEKDLESLAIAQKVYEEGIKGAMIIDEKADKELSWRMAEKIIKVINKHQVDAATILTSLVYVVTTLITTLDKEMKEHGSIPHELQMAAFMALLHKTLTGTQEQPTIN